ncbi:hypothetical protein NN561_009704 [Cricetulus griseus]
MAGRRTSHCAVLSPGVRSERSADRSPAPQPRHPQADSRPRHPFPAKRLLQLPLPFAKPGADCEPRVGPRESCSPFFSLSHRDPRTPGPCRRRQLRSLRSPARTLRAARVSSRLCLRRRAEHPGDAARTPRSRPPGTAASAHRRPPREAPRLPGAVAACARAGEAAPYLSLRSRGASSRAASASPPPLLRSRRASSCSRRWDRRAEPAAAACAGAPLRLASRLGVHVNPEPKVKGKEHLHPNQPAHGQAGPRSEVALF